MYGYKTINKLNLLLGREPDNSKVANGDNYQMTSLITDKKRDLTPD